MYMAKTSSSINTTTIPQPPPTIKVNKVLFGFNFARPNVLGGSFGTHAGPGGRAFVGMGASGLGGSSGSSTSHVLSSDLVLNSLLQNMG